MRGDRKAGTALARVDEHRMSMERWEKIMNNGLTVIAHNFAQMVGRLLSGAEAARRIAEFNTAILELQRANETLLRLHGPGPSRMRRGAEPIVTLTVPLVVAVAGTRVQGKRKQSSGKRTGTAAGRRNR